MSIYGFKFLVWFGKIIEYLYLFELTYNVISTLGRNELLTLKYLTQNKNIPVYKIKFVIKIKCVLLNRIK